MRRRRRMSMRRYGGARTGAHIMSQTEFNAMGDDPISLLPAITLRVPVMLYGERDAVYEADELIAWLELHQRSPMRSSRMLGDPHHGGLVVVQVGDDATARGLTAEREAYLRSRGWITSPHLLMDTRRPAPPLIRLPQPPPPPPPHAPRLIRHLPPPPPPPPYAPRLLARS